MSAQVQTRLWLALAAVLSLSLTMNGFLLSRLIDRFDKFDERLRMVEISVAANFTHSTPKGGQP